MSEQNFPPYEQTRKEFSGHAASAAEIPLSHYVSVPLPTMRWGEPAYAAWAAPAARAPRQPMIIDPPDRWLVLGMHHRLLAFAYVEAVPFTDGPLGDRVTIPPSRRPLSAVREDQRFFDGLVERALPGFFAGDPGDASLRADLSAALGLVLPAPCLQWSRALTPDFFAWLER